MSELITNKITPGTGSSDTVTLGDSGDTFTIPAGVTLAGSGASLTALPAANLTGTLPAIDGSNLTNLPTGWVLLSSTTVSDAATVDQTGIVRATYPTVAVIISDLLPASAGQALYVRFGDSSGFDTGASDYTHAIQYGDASGASNTFTQANDTTNGFINTDTGGVGGAAGEGVSSILYVSTGHNGGRARMQGTSVCTNGSGNMVRNVSFGQRNDVIVLDRIRVYFNSGNIASGNVAFYGLAIS